MPPTQRSATSGGLPYALGAYLIWGLLPLYLRFVHQVPPLEFVALRIVFTVPLCLLFIAARRQGPDLAAAIANRAIMLRLLASALLIGANWLVYIFAIQQGHVFAASLGYYVNPLINVLLGTLFLHERLSRLQWGAVALAVAGVSLLAMGALDTLWVSLTLAVSFGLYGMVRKVTPVGSLPGLTIESSLLLFPAAAVAGWYALSPAGSSFGQDINSSLLIASSGLLTAVPLVFFAIAARKMAYSTLGFLQFLAPTIVFILGLTVFHEPLRPVQLASFCAIWAAAALFIWDLVAQRRLDLARAGTT